MKAQKSIWIMAGFVTIVLIGLMVLTIKQGPSLTGFISADLPLETVKTCYELTDEGLVPNADIADCCTTLRNSAGCQKYVSEEIIDELYKCKSDRIMVANKALITFCMGK